MKKDAKEIQEKMSELEEVETNYTWEKLVHFLNSSEDDHDKIWEEFYKTILEGMKHEDIHFDKLVKEDGRPVQDWQHPIFMGDFKDTGDYMVVLFDVSAAHREGFEKRFELSEIYIDIPGLELQVLNKVNVNDYSAKLFHNLYNLEHAGVRRMKG